mgnify:CR=1 FL=1
MAILKNTKKAKVLATVFAAFSALSACGGEEEIRALGNLSPGDVVSVGGQKFLIENISNDNSSITIKAYLEGFTQGFTLATLTLRRQPSGLFSFESPSLSITYDPADGSLAWDIDPGTTPANLEAELLTRADTIASTSTLEAFALGIALDSDGDGVNDTADAFPLDPTETTDTDSDGTGDNADADADGDGVNDTADAFPLDPTETTDTDSDGTGDNADADADGDGLANIYDDSPYDSGTSINGAKVLASALNVSFLPNVPLNEDWTEGNPRLNSARTKLATASALHELYVAIFEGVGAVAAFSPDFSYSNINVDGLEAAHDAGWTGDGARLVIFDGFNGSSVNPLYDYSNGTYSPTHGSNTFNLAYAVAPGANFVLYEMFGDRYTYSNALYDMTYGKADDTRSFADFSFYPTNRLMDAANLSLGVHLTDGASLNSSLISAANFVSNTLQPIANALPNAVIVESAGNNGAVNSLSYTRGCSVWGGRNSASSCTDVAFALNSNYYDALDRTIFVGAYDSDTEYLTDYSVSAGLAADHFIVADGTSILDTGMGTSYAAPRVTGVIGLISHKFPELSAQARKGLILDTATDLGDAGVDGVFGHGLLNVTNALSPLGLLR